MINRMSLIEFFKEPNRHLNEFTSISASQFLQLAREESLVAALYPLAQTNEFPLKNEILRHATSYYCFAEKQYQTLVRELLELELVFEQCNYPILLVKGASYRLAGYEYAKYRLFSDIDILVRKDNFEDCIRRLISRGYIEQTTSDYEKQYYLNWSHQYPPLRHIFRTAEIDVHHTIFFARSSVQVNIEPMFSRAKRIENSAFSLPNINDMFIHACLHLFYQEEHHKLARDLIDLHALYVQIVDKSEIIESAEICNYKAAVCYGIMIQHWLFAETLSDAEQSFIKTQCSEPRIKRIKFIISHLLNENSRLHRFALIAWYIRGHSIKMNFTTLLYHSGMKLLNYYRKSKLISLKQKEQDLATKPIDA